MPAPATLTEGKASSLGARLYDAMVDTTDHAPLSKLPPMTQAYYERAAVRFTASLTYAESEGVREALLSSVLLEALTRAHSALAYATVAAREDGGGMAVHLDAAEWSDFQAARNEAEAAIAEAEAVR